MLALVDVIWLVFYNIDYSSSLHLSLGIMCCGVLCFGISFIYSRLARASVDKNDDEQVPAEDVEQ